MPKAVDGENQVPPMSIIGPAAMSDLRGKCCMVTGGGSGIGAMTEHHRAILNAVGKRRRKTLATR